MLARGLKEGRHSCGDHTNPKRSIACPLSRGGVACGGCGVYVGENTVNKEPACPVTPHHICGTAGTCQGSCVGGSLTWRYMATMMVLLILWDCLSTMEKLSSLMECLVVWE